MIFDTHAHYDSNAFHQDRDEVLRAVHDAGVGLILDPGCEAKSSRKAIELAEKYDFVYAAVGIHPSDLDSADEDSLLEIRSLSEHPKCVAIGEIGLDYYWDDTRKEEQKRLFRWMIELALELDKPIIVHDREAHADCMEVVLDYPELRGVFHCYSGSVEMAQALWKRGWYLGFDGPVTYKNARRAIEVLEACPSDRLLIETDSPYLSPIPMRGKRNDSRNLRYVIERIAEIRALPPEEIERISMENGLRLFGIDI